MHEEAIPDQIALGIALAHIIEFLKNSRWFPWLSQMTPLATRVVSVAASWAAGIGVEVSLNDWGGVVQGGDIHIHIPMLSVIVGSLLHGSFQWGASEFWYQQMIRPKKERNENATRLDQPAVREPGT